MFCVLDIETLEKPMPESILSEALRNISKKNCERYKKPEVIEAHIAEDTATFKDRWKFSRRGAQVLAIGMMIIGDDNTVLDQFCLPNKDEIQVLEDAWNFVRLIRMSHRLAASTKIYTFNGDSFDIPILIAACARCQTYPIGGLPFRNFIDLMKRPLEQYCSGNESLQSLFELHCIHNVPKEYKVQDYPDADGSLVAEMWEKDQVDNANRVGRYCLADCWMTGQIAFALNQFFEW